MSGMSSDAADLAARLLDAHVDYERRRLTDPVAFAALVEEEITAFLDAADQLPLEEAVSRDLVKAVARKYAIAFPVDGAIPGLVGTVASRIYEYSTGDDTRLGDVLERRRYEELAAGVAELGLSRRMLKRVLDSPATEDACVEAIQRAVDSSRMPGPVATVVDSMVERIARRCARTVLAANRAEADHLVLDAAREVWLAGADQSVGDVRDVLSSSDVEDAVVLVFEFWRTFRETPFFRAILDEGVDEVFDTYGTTSLSDLLDELGVGRDDLVEEAMRFGPPVIARIDADGFVEAALRRRLSPFYTSAEFAALVGR
ncbi:hypothetical protein [Gordonia sihwensis]|uniref:Uncharacterized protein n=2 Tax=Gordoniaceae TaxID=85026 RepID=L7LPH9_9ACTN|nr:hypothetical protein GSI01S_45_00110 [Gordonia sihwensis NBRC 108236]